MDNYLVDWEELAKSIENSGLRNKTLIAEIPIVTDDGKHLQNDMFYLYSFNNERFVGKYIKEKRIFITNILNDNPTEHSALKCCNIHFVQ